MKSMLHLRFSIVALSAAALCLGGCAYFTGTAQHLAATPAGSEIVSKAADKVIQKGLNAGAARLDATGNAYLHSVADALRSNPDGILDPAFVQKAFADYGDPNNKTKFKTLSLDIWNIAKEAAIRFGKANAAELLAKGLQDGATAGPKPTAADGP